MQNHDTLLTRFKAVRGTTDQLARPLSEEDCCAQSMPQASPVKWHLAHTTWFFETFVLETHEPDYAPYHPAFRVLFNSYYHGIGKQYDRPHRGLITRPSLAEVKRYRADVDARILALLQTHTPPDKRAQLKNLITLGLNHEQQHQELILTDIQHLLWHNPLLPRYNVSAPEPAPAPITEHARLLWRTCEGGVINIGSNGKSFHFDNETPRHRQYLEPYQIANRLVTNAEYLDFIEAGGYRDPALWLSDGWAWLHETSEPLSHPLYWTKSDQHWAEFDLNGQHDLDPHAAVRHISYFEADAYARWAGARLPTEAEWEHAVSAHVDDSEANNAAGSTALVQLFDTAWQWTSSSYGPYPGYQAPAGAIGEYNGKFMVNQYVLRGGSSATPLGHSRASYRNFFQTDTRWQYTGIRLARDIS